MAERRPLRIDLVCEDAAHEGFARGLLRRLGSEEAVELSIRTASARLGIPRLQTELRALQRVRRAGGGDMPDVLAVLIDANRLGAGDRRREVEQAIDASLFPALVIGIPDPYVERWLLSDPASFAAVFGSAPSMGGLGPRSRWKEALVDALESSGQIVVQGGAEFAEEIIDAMDLHRAGRNAPSLGTFVTEVRAALRRLGRDLAR